MGIIRKGQGKCGADVSGERAKRERLYDLRPRPLAGWLLKKGNGQAGRPADLCTYRFDLRWATAGADSSWSQCLAALLCPPRCSALESMAGGCLYGTMEVCGRCLGSRSMVVTRRQR